MRALIACEDIIYSVRKRLCKHGKKVNHKVDVTKG